MWEFVQNVFENLAATALVAMVGYLLVKKSLHDKIDRALGLQQRVRDVRGSVAGAKSLLAVMQEKFYGKLIDPVADPATLAQWFQSEVAQNRVSQDSAMSDLDHLSGGNKTLERLGKDEQ
jgi:hypothetical protein